MDTSYCLYLIPVFIALYVAVVAANKLIKLDLATVKYPEIDGIRGYLAFFVFLHHSYIWHSYIQTKNWEEPESHLFNHFGQTSVALFFVITAFLFITKLIEAKTAFDWKHYLKARFFRMFPMYFCIICLLFFIVGCYTHFEQNDSGLNILKSVFSWLFFSVQGMNDINGFKGSFIIVAGVTWTLPYEWMFYFLLPVFALLMRKKVAPRNVALFLLAFLVSLYLNQSSIKLFMPFIAGIIASFLLRSDKLKSIAKQPVFTMIAIALMVCSVCFFDSGRKPVPIIIDGILFVIIASGNSFFGLLSSAFSRKFGQITYSLYLVHGLLLFIVFDVIIGLENAAKFTNLEYWGVIALTVIPLLFISQFTFKYIELPMMNILKNKKS